MLVALNITDENKAHFEELLKKTGCEDYKELLASAIIMLEWGVKSREQGRIIANLDEEKMAYSELKMPALEHIVPKVGATAPTEPKRHAKSFATRLKEKQAAAKSSPDEPHL